MDEINNANPDALSQWLTGLRDEFGANIWIRPPVGKDVCKFTHLKHSQFYASFCGNSRIRQARLGRGKHRGVRLLYLPDIYRELSRLAAEQGTTGSPPPENLEEGSST